MKRRSPAKPVPPAVASQVELVDPQPLSLRLIVSKRALVDAIEEFISAKIEAHTTAAEYYTQEDSPLGRRRHCRLARTGALKARRVGRDWLVRRGDVEAYLESHGRPSPDVDTVANVIRRIAG